MIEIMKALRTPETGCPWDLDQDFSSIAPYTIEEAYEVADAIERGNMVDLMDELGDLLLQVVYHSQMAAEKGAFDFGDVVETITAKMIRRHPHVFGDEKARDAGMAKNMWETMKAAERAGVLESSNTLDSVPRALPALTRAYKLQSRAARVGFDWAETGQVLDKIEEEIGELREAIKSGLTDQIEAEIGDLIFAMVNLARHRGIDAEKSLSGTNAKFTRRFAYIEKTLADRGESLEHTSLDKMEDLWQQAKTLEK